jgi:drug/metabolite transporter (DMT)-like permease
VTAALASTGRPTRLRVAAAFAAVYVLWGSTYLAIRFALESLPPFWMASSRFLIAGTLLYVWARRRGEPAPTRIHWRSALIVGGLLLMGGNGGVVWAEQRVPSGLAALLVATVPLWMVMLDGAGRGWRRPPVQVLLGIGLGLAGVALLVGPGKFAGGLGVDPLGAGALLLGALCWATGSLYSRRAPLPPSPLLGTAMEMLGGGACLAVAGLVSGEWGRLDLAAATPRSLLAVGYLVVFGSLVGFTAYVWLLRVSTPPLVATYAYVNPVVAVLLGWAFAGEPVTARTLVAAAVIVGAVVLITTYRARPQVVVVEVKPEAEAKAAGVRMPPALPPAVAREYETEEEDVAVLTR